MIGCGIYQDDVVWREFPVILARKLFVFFLVKTECIFSLRGRPQKGSVRVRVIEALEFCEGGAEEGTPSPLENSRSKVFRNFIYVNLHVLTLLNALLLIFSR